MFGPIRAVAIDDEPGHLLAITTALSASGIPSMGYWFDRQSNTLRPDPPAGGMPHLRLIFMDLNLAELGGFPDAASLCGTVISVLKDLVSKEGGPYLLIFWTQVGTSVADVKALLYQRLEASEGIPCPIEVIELTKAPFIINNPEEKQFQTALGEFYSDLHKIVGDLREAVKQAVSQNPQLSALSAWESRASDAAAGAVNDIFACAKEDAPDPAARTASIKTVLAKIALAAAGKASAVAAPARALDSGMVDILVDQFGASVERPEYQAAIKSAIGAALEQDKVVCQNDGQVAAALNTFFHVDTQVTSATAGDRGAVISTKTFKPNDLGFKPSDYLDDFLIPYEIYPDERKLQMKSLWDAFRKSREFVLVELGADCDHAQDIARTRRYLLGLEVPVRFSELLRFPDTGKLRNEALQLLGPWTIDSRTTFLLVSCRRFWAWQNKEPHASGKVRYRLRSSLVNKLLHHYASFHSRPGIVEFPSDFHPGTFVYFAYGSNMVTARLTARAPSAVKIGTAVLDGHKLTFDKISCEGSGKCDVRPSENAADQVHGVLFLIDSKDKAALDLAEGGYSHRAVTVVAAGAGVHAETYIGNKTDPQVRPYDWYVELVAAGAAEHALPEAYLETIRATPSQADPDQSRSAKNRAALQK